MPDDPNAPDVEDPIGLAEKRQEATSAIAAVDVKTTKPPPPGQKAPDLQTAETVQKDRINIGRGYAAAGGAIILLTLWHVLGELHSIQLPPDTDKVVHLHPLAYLKFGGHAVVVGLFVWFGYQLMRAGERLMLPWWWASTNIEIARAMLGMSDPIRSAVRMTSKMAREVLEVLKEAVKVTKGGGTD